MNDLSFQQLQDVPGTTPGTFFIGLDSDERLTMLLDLNKILGVPNGGEGAGTLELEEVCGMVWKLLNLAYSAQERYNSTKAPENPFIRAFVRPVVTVESTQAEVPIGIGRGVLNVRVPYIPQTIDPAIEAT